MVRHGFRRALALAACFAAAGCGDRARAPGRGVEAPTHGAALADSAESGAPPPASPGTFASFTLVRVAPTRAEVSTPLPEPEPSAPSGGEAAGEGLAADDELRPPIPRGQAPRLESARPARVELDVRVDENGEVTDAIPAGGDAEPALVHAAVQAALAQRYFPATRGGRPVAVWCRQRFEAGRAR